MNNCNEELFWKYVTIQVYNAAEYRTSLTRNTYHEDIILDLNKKIGELKKIVSEQTKVPVHRIHFQIYQRELILKLILIIYLKRNYSLKLINLQLIK